MSTRMSSWIVPLVGLVLGVLIAAALLGREASPLEAVVAFAIVAGYALGVHALQSRSDMASLLSGMPRDERWEAINLRALSMAAQLLAVALVSAFLVTEFAGGDATAYTWLGALFGATYLGGLVWYRSRS
ncbi:MAG TPA: hypothetical protein VK194_11115 [Candidatus Deferrimicrobium sp.]|nr:hypothetical protein [Candidatus Deferrimicrobium sp.]